MIIVCTLKYPKMLNCYITDIVETSSHTLIDWQNFIRESISAYYLEKPLVLGGVNAAQIDESMFGGRRKYNRGDHQKHYKSWVFGIVEEGTRRCMLWRVNRRNRKTLFKIIYDHVENGSTIKSDEWAAYKGLDRRGFKHCTVNHSISFVSEEGIHTQLIESVWSEVKSSLKLKRGTSRGHLAGYLDLYSFRCDAKYQKKDPIDFFMELIQIGKLY